MELTSNSQKACLAAVPTGNMGTLAEMLANEGNASYQALEWAPSTLHTAVASGMETLVRNLIEAGADVNAKCKFLLEGASSISDWSYDVTPLVLATSVSVRAHFFPFVILIHRNFPPQYGYDKIAEILIEAGAEQLPVQLDCLDEEKCPPLFLAILKGKSVAMVDVFLRSGAYYLRKTFRGMTVLHAAINAMASVPGCDASVLRHLLSHPDIDANILGDEENGLPQHYAIFCKALGAVEALMEAGADPNARADFNVGERGSDIWKKKRFLRKIPSLNLAAYYGFSEAVGPLVAAGALVDAHSSSGLTPLHWASIWYEKSKEDIVQVEKTIEALISAGADVNSRRFSSDPYWARTPLYQALYHNFVHPRICGTLIKLGADTNEIPHGVSGLLEVALSSRTPGPDSWRGIPEKIQAMEEAGIDFSNARYPTTGRLLLHEWALRGRFKGEQVVRMLMQAGADAAAKDEEGRTALSLLLRANGERDGEPWKRYEDFSAETVATLVLGGDIDSWDSIPTQFQGLERMMKPLIKKAPEKLGLLFSKLTTKTQTEIRVMLRVLHRLLPGEGLELARIKIVANNLSFYRY